MSSKTRAVTVADIEAEFGKEIAEIVDGLTKIGHLPLNSSQERQVENYRKLLLSIAKDARVILIKLADRLHNMRTLEFLPAEKRAAHRPGDAGSLCAARAPLRNGARSVGARGPRVQASRAGRVQVARQAGFDAAREREKTDRAAARAARRALNEAGIPNVEVTGRPKHLWSIYKKMKKWDKPYEEIYDLLAIRVLVNSVPDCYHALGVIHEQYTPLQERIKDYIAQPKSNGYQSLHTTVFGPEPAAVRDPDPHARDAPHRGVRNRGALAVQGEREERRRARSRAAVVPAGARASARREDA